ncbi:MAG: hypothetical protein EBX52_09445, partial [Proteobacteria bacterium]|nr:hypothetical protein [Pseudomonadota bacterium]
MIFSGGVFYHLRALRYRKAYWDQHHNGVRKFLEEWNPASKKLLLVGPSAGYSLPSDWLARFDSIEAFEPDPVA